MLEAVVRLGSAILTVQDDGSSLATLCSNLDPLRKCLVRVGHNLVDFVFRIKFFPPGLFGLWG